VCGPVAGQLPGDRLSGEFTVRRRCFACLGVRDCRQRDDGVADRQAHPLRDSQEHCREPLAVQLTQGPLVVDAELVPRGADPCEHPAEVGEEDHSEAVLSGVTGPHGRGSDQRRG
jgi:hypothetical protein